LVNSAARLQLTFETFLNNEFWKHASVLLRSLEILWLDDDAYVANSLRARPHQGHEQAHEQVGQARFRPRNNNGVEMGLRYGIVTN